MCPRARNRATDGLSRTREARGIWQLSFNRSEKLTIGHNQALRTQ